MPALYSTNPNNPKGGTESSIAYAGAPIISNTEAHFGKMLDFKLPIPNKIYPIIKNRVKTA
jgi:hypothetical protein